MFMEKLLNYMIGTEYHDINSGALRACPPTRRTNLILRAYNRLLYEILVRLLHPHSGFFMQTPHLVDKYYFNTASGAAWKFINQDGNILTGRLVRIAAKWTERHGKYIPGKTVQEFDWNDLFNSEYKHNWIVVDDLKAAIALYSPNEEMLESD